jgi:hypothetical protein
LLAFVENFHPADFCGGQRAGWKRIFVGGLVD